MTNRNSSAIFALFVSILLASPAGAAGNVASVGFQCTNDPQYRVWYHSFAHDPYSITPADATAWAERDCKAEFHGTPVNAEVVIGGRTVPISATAPLPTNLSPEEASNAVPAEKRQRPK
jgi:hypothetical protein